MQALQDAFGRDGLHAIHLDSSDRHAEKREAALAAVAVDSIEPARGAVLGGMKIDE